MPNKYIMKKQKAKKPQPNKKNPKTQTPELGESKFVVEGMKSGKQIFESEKKEWRQ